MQNRAPLGTTILALTLLSASSLAEEPKVRKSTFCAGILSSVRHNFSIGGINEQRTIETLEALKEDAKWISGAKTASAHVQPVLAYQIEGDSRGSLAQALGRLKRIHSQVEAKILVPGQTVFAIRNTGMERLLALRQSILQAERAYSDTTDEISIFQPSFGKLITLAIYGGSLANALGPSWRDLVLEGKPSLTALFAAWFLFWDLPNTFHYNWQDQRTEDEKTFLKLIENFEAQPEGSWIYMGGQKDLAPSALKDAWTIGELRSMAVLEQQMLGQRIDYWRRFQSERKFINYDIWIRRTFDDSLVEIDFVLRFTRRPLRDGMKRFFSGGDKRTTFEGDFAPGLSPSG